MPQEVDHNSVAPDIESMEVNQTPEQRLDAERGAREALRVLGIEPSTNLAEPAPVVQEVNTRADMKSAENQFVADAIEQDEDMER